MKEYSTNNFSANNFAKQDCRLALEQKYLNLITFDDSINRQFVSNQLNKKQPFYGWFKYKEAFSSELVKKFIIDFEIKKDSIVLDPFIGSGTAAFVCKNLGIHCLGFDILPITKIIINVKDNIFNFQIDKLIDIYNKFLTIKPEIIGNLKLNTVKITEFAYPEKNERYFAYITELIKNFQYPEIYKNLLTLAVLSSLEECSYTEKAGQYLKWDSRSQKVINFNKRRKNPLKPYCTRQNISYARDSFLKNLRNIIQDIVNLQNNRKQDNFGKISFFQNSCLFELPLLDDNSIDAVITSPPYCNRYDYTRTYALELAYLGLSESEIKELRQKLISCTVENKDKTTTIENFYTQHGLTKHFAYIKEIIDTNQTFLEIINSLKLREKNNDLNNKGIIKMVYGYFTELCFIYAELYRICKKGAKVIFVNDNVRYGGEVIPVDFLSCDFAESFGFRIKKIYSLKQMKGNSSQQMAKFGKVPLRKSITVWEK